MRYYIRAVVRSMPRRCKQANTKVSNLHRLYVSHRVLLIQSWDLTELFLVTPNGHIRSLTLPPQVSSDVVVVLVSTKDVLKPCIFYLLNLCYNFM
jgi:predicted cupin superfamily sugar epimerase